MTKQNVSATVCEDVYEILEQTDNKSATIEKAVLQYEKAGGNERAMIELRLEQERSRRQSLEGELEAVENEIERLEKRLEELNETKEQERKQTLQDAINRFDVVEYSSMDSPVVDASDEKLQEYADDLDMSIEELKDAIITEANE